MLQATQIAQQMLVQQQQQPVAMPFVALPDWNGKEAEGHLNLLDATLHANNGETPMVRRDRTGILNEPNRYSALLFKSCKNERKATEFFPVHLRHHSLGNQGRLS